MALLSLSRDIPPYVICVICTFLAIKHSIVPASTKQERNQDAHPLPIFTKTAAIIYTKFEQMFKSVVSILFKQTKIHCKTKICCKILMESVVKRLEK